MMKYLKSDFIRLSAVMPLISVAVIGCTPGTSIQNQYVSTLEELIGTQAETDGDKQAIMAIYKELGGSDISKQRADQTCTALKSGKVVEDITNDPNLSLNAMEALHLARLGRPLHDDEMQKLHYATSLYIAEVLAAQSAICPETKVELKL